MQLVHQGLLAQSSQELLLLSHMDLVE